MLARLQESQTDEGMEMERGIDVFRNEYWRLLGAERVMILLGGIFNVCSVNVYENDRRPKSKQSLNCYGGLAMFGA